MSNKSRRLCNLPIRRVYVYSIRLYYVYVEVYVNLQVDVIKSFNFLHFKPMNLVHETNKLVLVFEEDNDVCYV